MHYPHFWSLWKITGLDYPKPGCWPNIMRFLPTLDSWISPAYLKISSFYPTILHTGHDYKYLIDTVIGNLPPLGSVTSLYLYLSQVFPENVTRTFIDYLLT